MTLVLIADIGGTNARFALADESGVHDPQTLKVADYPGPAEAAFAYLAASGRKPERAVFAVAGPITGQDVFELTNFPWRFSITGTAAALGVGSLELINDFHAQALGVVDVAPENCIAIGGGLRDPNGNIGVIGPGTGLGVATLVRDPQTGRYFALPGEGGHVTLPATNPREFALIDWLLRHKYTHVSAERVCSGKGLVNIYDAIRGLDNRDLPELAPEQISDRAVHHKCDACREALTLMMAFLGRIAGNLALTNTTTGGIFFVGGILPRLGAPYVTTSRMRGDFTAKGRQTSYVDRIATFLIDDQFLPLRGLRNYALAQ